MYSHKQNCNVFIVSRLVPCALALLCLTGHLVPATGKPYTSSERDLINDNGDTMERHKMINNGRLNATQVIQQLRLQMYKMIRKGVKPMPSRRSDRISYCVWKVCPADPLLMAKLHTKPFNRW